MQTHATAVLHSSRVSFSSKKPYELSDLLLLLLHLYRKLLAMAVKPTRSQKKIIYDKKLCAFLSDYSQILVVHADNVGSNQLQNIRRGLRGDSVILMGKNTMMKRSIKIHAEKTGNEAIKNLIPLLVV